MKISYNTLQTYFEKSLPGIEAVADAFTFHAFEIDSIEEGVLDVKVLPNRAADCNTEEGLARELSAILNTPFKNSHESDYTNVPTVSVTLARINAVMGSEFSLDEVLGVFNRLRFRVETDGDILHVSAPLPRTDIVLLEDVAEEVGRIIGYDRVVATDLPPFAGTPDQARFRGTERMKDQLVEKGFIEVSTRSFTKKGDTYLANPLDTTMPALRTSLEENLQDALARARQYAPLVLAPKQMPKLFEVGTVFPKEGEYVELRMTERVQAWGDSAGVTDNLSLAKLEEYGKDYEPVRYEMSAYKPFSLYPFITRDIALWAEGGVEDGERRETSVERIIRDNAGGLLVRLDLFDTFEKGGNVSYAFRLVFQSSDRTLTDVEVNSIMDNISAALRAAKYEIR